MVVVVTAVVIVVDPDRHISRRLHHFVAWQALEPDRILAILFRDRLSDRHGRWRHI